jgi:hypothetical protein
MIWSLRMERFDVVDRRFDDMLAASDKRFAALQWTVIVGFTIVAAAVTVFRVLA